MSFFEEEDDVDVEGDRKVEEADREEDLDD